MFRFSKKTIEVNEEQKKAITRPRDTNQRIIASAGSGKTTTITARIAYLIEHYKIESNRIVLLTFSKNSANQMKNKLFDLIGDNQVYAGTFHGLAKSLLQKFSPKTTQTLYFIDELVSMGEQWLKTYDGRKWVGKIQYVFVDEFQDINVSQWNMVLRMLWPGARLVVVGDDSQNIYTWRGSNVNFILDLDKHIKNVVDDQLNINYRSSDNIIQVANAVMKHIPTLPWKHTMVSAIAKHSKPEIHFFYRACDETAWIIRQIEEQLKENPSITIAIMSRINVDLYRFEELCIQRNISYRLFDLTTCDETTEIQKNSIDLVTIHSSKGLEWDTVYLVHTNDDVFPSSKKKEDIINERRLFYVAVTRARKQLYMSYTNDERNLSRFIREIPNILLTYTGLAKYMLSEFELGKVRKRLVDMLGCLTTDDLASLRTDGYLDWFSTEMLEVKSLYPIDMFWKRPTWISNETLPDFQRFLNVWLKRSFCRMCKIPYRDPTAEKLIFTLRIFAEDLDFFNSNKESIKILVHHYFANPIKGQDIPNVDYKMIETFAKDNSILWSSKDIVYATNILGKIRGQLRPLRFYNYDIREFNIGPSRFVVPIQWRGEVLESWRRIINTSIDWKDCLVDIWRIGALSLVAEGRNVAMYRAPRLKEHLKDIDFIKFLECVEQYTNLYISQENLLATSLYIENEDDIQETIDLQSEKSLMNIGGLRFDSAELLRLAIASSFFEEHIESVGVFIPLDGKLFSLRLPQNIKEISRHILNIALSK